MGICAALVGSACAWRRATGERETCWRKRGASLVSGIIVVSRVSQESADFGRGPILVRDIAQTAEVDFEAWTQHYPDIGGLREVKNLQKKGVPARQRDIQRETHTHTDIDTHTETHTLTQHTRLNTSH